jgi:ribosomal protein S18 acetylase RimI-like enzyme
MKIRAAQLDDALPMARVFVDTFLATYRGILSDKALAQRRAAWPYAPFAERYRKKLNDIEEERANGNRVVDCFFVAEGEGVGGEVVGFAYGCTSKDESAPPDVGELDLLYVREEHQGQGIGRALLYATAVHFARAGLRQMQLCTPVDHAQARGFYDKLGGRIVGARTEEEDGETIHLVVYKWESLSDIVENSGEK